MNDVIIHFLYKKNIYFLLIYIHSCFVSVIQGVKFFLYFGNTKKKLHFRNGNKIHVG